MNELVELQSSWLQCDNPNCDWEDKGIAVDDWENWINAKCPKCGDNLLTLEDYENAMATMKAVEFINKLGPEQLKELPFSTDDFKKAFGDVKGIEHVDGNNDVIISVGTHKEIKIKEFKKAE